MNRFVPMEKQQKKKRRELAAKQRGGWGGINPVTRKPENPKAYNRKKAGQWRKTSSHDLPFAFLAARRPFKNVGAVLILASGGGLL